MLCYSQIMLIDSYIIPECIAGPGSFGGLMALYESNFIKLTRLVGELKKLDPGYLSVTPGDCDLYLTVNFSSKYTHALTLTYLFEEPEGIVADPDLRVRVYLDARMTEVRGWAAHHRHTVLKNLAQQLNCELDRRWFQNMMLSKWLDYLIDMGHAFSPLSESQLPEAVLS